MLLLGQEKICTKCRLPKPLDEFYANGKGGKRGRCAKCYAEYGKNWSAAHPEKRRAAQRKSEMKRRCVSRYGISPEQHAKLIEESGGLCRICGQPEPQARRKALSLDHDHATKQVRGMTCSRCNTILGLAKDDPEVLEKAAQYLRLHQLKVAS